MPHRPNILLITCDQLRTFEVGCYGNPIIHTPHLDALAAGGVRFQTAGAIIRSEHRNHAPSCCAA